ncbi:hypothetical protein SLS53_001668 [Cytospora paraplurivora]|uniref:Uncharacterized protein n=1 Tax=Cytospora paraplurivora TaxID=2898453 RepID=A0AAN9URD4_9PEZI
MGFSFRGKTSEQPVNENDAASSAIDISANPAADLKKFRKLHTFDPFLDIDKLEAVDNVLVVGDVEKEAAVEEQLLVEDSPYPEVRSSVPPTDDMDTPVDTIRAWAIGMFLCTIVAAVNILLGLRKAPVTISASVVQLISYPIARAWTAVMPNKEYTLFGRKFNLNPCPFNQKEHTIITVMTAAGAANSYAIDILLAQEVYYGQYFGWGFQILLIMSTQAMGYGLAGVMRRYLVWPAAMVWPNQLIPAVVISTLHNHEPSDPAKTNGWRIGRYAFFLVVAGCTFVYEWFPLVIAQFLAYIGLFPTWIAPNNAVVNQVFGGLSGLGIIPLSFDWSVISGFMGSSPLMTPGFALMNLLAGMVLVIVGTAGISWAGPAFMRYLPLEANANFDHFGNNYNVSRILTPQYTFNQTAYEEYSPLLIGPAFSLSYGVGFAGLIATIVHCFLFYGVDIYNRAKSAKYEEPDVHLRLMRKYKEAPEWWFQAIFIVSFAFAMISSQVWDTHLKWWALIICIVIGVFFTLPVGILTAITNQEAGLNVITEMIVGYMTPGRPVAMMLFKSYGYMMTYNCLQYVADMKLGHYMKIPPRSLFRAQFFPVIWLSIVQIAVYNFLRGNIVGICTTHQAQGLTCPNAKTFYNASVIWGVIGPARMFGAGKLFSWVNWFWLIGAACPVIHYLAARRYPRSWLRYLFTPAIFGAAGMIPPATTWYLMNYVLFGLAFNWVVRRRFFGWWQHYNYVLSGALDIGLALTVVISGLSLGLSNKSFPDWWGNVACYNTADQLGTAVTKVLPDDGSFFGPTKW